MTTYRGFYDELKAITVPGVKRSFDWPPITLAGPELPALWVEVPTGDETPITFITHGGYPAFEAELIVAIEPVAQNVISVTYPEALDMMDNVSLALRGSAQTFQRGKVTWSIRKDIVEVGGVAYHAIIAEVNGNG